MKLDILALETPTQNIFQTLDQKFRIFSAVGGKIQHTPASGRH